MEIHGAFRCNELQDVEGELFQTLFEIQSGIIKIRERFIRFAAKRLDAANEETAFPAKLAINRALRSAS